MPSSQAAGGTQEKHARVVLLGQLPEGRTTLNDPENRLYKSAGDENWIEESRTTRFLTLWQGLGYWIRILRAARKFC